MYDVVAASKGAGARDVADARMPQRPDGTPWANMGDPHGVAVTTGLADGRAVGFVVSSDRKWVARVDLQALYGMRKEAIVDMSPTVTMLDARTTK